MLFLKIKDETLAQIRDSQELGGGKQPYKYDSPWIVQKLAALWKAMCAWCFPPHPGCSAAVWLLCATLPSLAQFPACTIQGSCIWRGNGSGENDEVKDIFSCVCVWLWLTVSITIEKSSHHGEVVGWEGKVGRRPAFLQGDAGPVWQAEPVGQLPMNLCWRHAKATAPLSLKLAGSA